jgi:hypothetical protein
MSDTTEASIRRSYGGRIAIPVPRDEADAICEELRRHGIDPTLCLDPVLEEAHLEFLPVKGA